MNTIKIARRFNNLLDAVTELNVDLSYNRELALQDIEALSTSRHLKLVQVFADDAGQIWYILKSAKEGLLLLHKYEPFFSCLSNAPFQIYAALKAGEVTLLDFADSLKRVGALPNTNESRRTLATADLIAG